MCRNAPWRNELKGKGGTGGKVDSVHCARCAFRSQGGEKSLGIKNKRMSGKDVEEKKRSNH